MSQEAFTIPTDVESEECVVKPARQRGINAPENFNPGSHSGSEPEKEEAPAKGRRLPEYVQKNFLEVGGDFYFPNREPAFSYKNDELRTKSTSPEVVKAFVAIAKEEEWGSLTVSGNKDFRRAVWLEASAQGIEVKGYTPTEIEKAQAAKLAEKYQSRENVVTPSEKLKEKTEGPAQSKDKTFETESKPQPKQRDGGQADLLEKAKVFKEGDKAEALRRFPDLAGAYATLSVAEKFAGKNLAPEQAERFVQGVKEKYTDKIERKDPLPAPTVKRSSILKLHEQRQRLSKENTPEPAPATPSEKPASSVQKAPAMEQPLAEKPASSVQKAPAVEQPLAEKAAPTAQKTPIKSEGSNRLPESIAIAGRNTAGYTPLDAGYPGAMLSVDQKARTFTGMLQKGGLSPERAILIAEVSKVKESIDPKGFAQEMAENKRMFESLANETTEEKCRVLAMMYEERLAKLRYNEQGEVNHEVSTALYNRQNKIREGLEQRKEAELLEAAKKPAPEQKRPIDPSAPGKTVDLENKQQFVAYLGHAGIDQDRAGQLYDERQNRKITEPRSYAREIDFERAQIAEMRSITRSVTKSDEEKADSLNKYVAANIVRNSKAARERENNERAKFVELMENQGIKSERAQVIYEARKIQKEVDPEQHAREQSQLKNIVSQCKGEGASQSETDRRISQLLSAQYDNLKVRASRDTMARDIVTNAENARIDQIRQQQKDRERDRAEQLEKERRERADQNPQRERPASRSRGRDGGPAR